MTVTKLASVSCAVRLSSLPDTANAPAVITTTAASPVSRCLSRRSRPCSRIDRAGRARRFGTASGTAGASSTSASGSTAGTFWVLAVARKSPDTPVTAIPASRRRRPGPASISTPAATYSRPMIEAISLNGETA